MNPQCRARLSGFCHPSSTSDLAQLIPRMEAVRTTEGFYYSAYPPMAPQPDQHWAAPQAGYQHSPWYGQPQMTPPPNQNYYTPQSNQYWYPPTSLDPATGKSAPPTTPTAVYAEQRSPPLRPAWQWA